MPTPLIEILPGPLPADLPAPPERLDDRVGIKTLATQLDRPQSGSRHQNRALRQAGLNSRRRRAAADTLFEAVRRMRTLDTLLTLGGYTGDLSAAALWWATRLWRAELTLDAATAAFGQSGLDAFDNPRARLGDWARDRDPIERLGVLASLPTWLATALHAELGDQAEPAAAALLEQAPVTLRVNLRHTTREAVLAALADAGLEARAGTWSASAVHLARRIPLGSLDKGLEAQLEVQDEGSQIVAELARPARSGLVVDFCAGAGGKSLALADRLPRGARLVAMDPRADALERGARRAERSGLQDRVTWELLERSGPLPAAAHGAQVVLVDAPCTGTGALRRDPAARWRFDTAGAASFPARQAGLLDRAATCLAPGGRLVYATCSLVAAENEAVVQAFLARHPGWRIQPVRELLGGERASQLGSGDTLRTWPHLQGMDGFFAAVLRAPTG